MLPCPWPARERHRRSRLPSSPLLPCPQLPRTPTSQRVQPLAGRVGAALELADRIRRVVRCWCVLRRGLERPCWLRLAGVRVIVIIVGSIVCAVVLACVRQGAHPCGRAGRQCCCVGRQAVQPPPRNAAAAKPTPRAPPTTHLESHCGAHPGWAACRRMAGVRAGAQARQAAPRGSSGRTLSPAAAADRPGPLPGLLLVLRAPGAQGGRRGMMHSKPRSGHASTIRVGQYTRSSRGSHGRRSSSTQAVCHQGRRQKQAHLRRLRRGRLGLEARRLGSAGCRVGVIALRAHTQ